VAHLFFPEAVLQLRLSGGTAAIEDHPCPIPTTVIVVIIIINTVVITVITITLTSHRRHSHHHIIIIITIVIAIVSSMVIDIVVRLAIVCAEPADPGGLATSAIFYADIMSTIHTFTTV
jgi:hypothetical protein